MNEAIEIFLDKCARNGLEHFRILPSRYPAFVVRNDDPENRGRIQTTTTPPGTGRSMDLWIDPSFNGAGPNRGEFWPPEVGDTVYVHHDRGRPDAPVSYSAGWHGEADVPKEFSTTKVSKLKNSVPERRGFVTRMGQTLVFSDEKGQESISLVRHIPDDGDPAHKDRTKSADRSKGSWSTVLLQPDGGVLITNDIGGMLWLDAANEEVKLIDNTDAGSNSVTLNKDGIKLIDNSGNFIVIDKGKVNIAASGDVTVQAPTFTAKTTGTNLSDGASEQVILGNIYTQARAQMNGKVAAAHQFDGAFLTAFASAASALAPTLSAMVVGPVAPLAAALLSFVGATAPTATPAASSNIQAGAAILQFEASGVTYLSKHTKTA